MKIGTKIGSTTTDVFDFIMILGMLNIDISETAVKVVHSYRNSKSPQLKYNGIKLVETYTGPYIIIDCYKNKISKKQFISIVHHDLFLNYIILSRPTLYMNMTGKPNTLIRFKFKYPEQVLEEQ